MYEPRFYRKWVREDDLMPFEVKLFETDLFILCDRMLKKEAEEFAYRFRAELLDYIGKNTDFGASLVPLPMDESAPDIAKDMLAKSAMAGVGPMAGVAGAIAEYVGKALLVQCSEIIIENGGDIFMKTDKERTLAVYAAGSPLSGKVSIRIEPEKTPLGVCTSSGKVGHSLSFGAADAAIIISSDAVLADCVATQTGNLVKGPQDLDSAIDYARSIKGITGALVILDDKMAVWGDIKLV